MSDEQKKLWWKWISWAAVLLLVIYPLSIGPAVWIAASVESEPVYRCFEVTYWPVIIGCAQSTPTLIAYNWYMYQWQRIRVPIGKSTF